MKINQILTFIVTMVLTLSCFMLDIHHNSLGRLGIYGFINPVVMAIFCSLIITCIIFKTHPVAIGTVVILCLLANLPPSAVGKGVNQDIIFAILIVVLFLPTAKRWIDN
jgi:hypothetical protein